MNTQESLIAIWTHTTCAQRALKPAVGHRHAVAGTPLYDKLVLAERALLELETEAKLQMAKEERSK